MDNINVFKNSKMCIMYKNPSKIISWISIVSIFTFIFIIISLFYKFNVYISVISYVDNKDKYNIKAIVDRKTMPFKKNYELYIEGKKYEYEVIEIKEYDTYYEMYLNCNLDKELLINNNPITLNFVKRKSTLMNEFIRKIKEEMMS